MYPAVQPRPPEGGLGEVLGDVLGYGLGQYGYGLGDGLATGSWAVRSLRR